MNKVVQPIRMAVQWGYFFFILWIGYRFLLFVDYCRGGAVGTATARPAAVEGFLPISALLGVRGWWESGSINPVHPAAVVILLAAVLVSLALRRSFCSWICPVGALSEVLWKCGFSLLRRNLSVPPVPDLLLRGIKYVLLLFFLYGIGIAMPEEVMSAFILSDYHKAADVRLLEFFLHPSPLAAGTVLFLLLLSVPFKGPFCRYLCPYGALLSLAALLSPVRVRRDRKVCVSCGACSAACPSHIDVMHRTSVGSPECVACWRCLGHCRVSGALEMRAAGRWRVYGIAFSLLVVAVFWGTTLAGKASGAWQTSIGLEEYVRLLHR